jgi:hypothetical protein
MLFSKKKKEIPEPEAQKAPEAKPEIKPKIFTSTVKEINGLIEISITCAEDSLENRDSLIRKDQIASVDMFYKCIGFAYYYMVWIKLSDSSSARGYEFYRKDDAGQLYNALSKLLKKKEAKPSASKKTV